MASIDLENVTKVIRTFNWKGEHTGYRIDQTFVPLDQGNSDARALSVKIAEGVCALVDPEINRAVPTYDRKGAVTGYDTDLGFVPAVQNNALFKILEPALKDGSCKLSEPECVIAAPKITDLIFCIPFDRPWPHLVGEFWRSWKYRPNDNSDWRDFAIKLSNLPSESKDLCTLIIKALGATQPPGLLTGRQLLPLKRGVLEVEVSVTSLRPLFKGERAAGFGWKHDYLEDLFQQDLSRSGRTAREGPSIEWLLAYAQQYLSRAVVDVTNGVINAFRREYGGNSIGHLSEDDLERAALVFARRKDASRVLHSLKFQPIQDFQLQGEWRERPATPATVELNRQLNTEGALLRIRGLIDAGFPLEAISVANAYLEMIALPLALAVTVGNGDAQEAVIRAGHRGRLEIINAAAVAEPKGYIFDALRTFMTTAEAIYPHRNDYMHELRSREHDYWRTVDQERQAKRLLNSLLDYFEVRIWLGWLATITTGGSFLSASAIAAAQLKAQSLHK